MATFTEEELQLAQDVIEAAIRENFANISVRKGTVMKELVAAAQSIGFAEINRRIEDLKATQSLKQAEENPDAVDDSVIDAILSNIFIARKEGSVSRGTLKVQTTSDRNRGIPQGTTFTTGNGLEFETETDLIAEGVPTAANSVQIREEEGTGLFFFLLPVVATAVGDQYSISQDTQLENATLGADIVLVTAFTDFSEGKGQETTSDLLERAKDAITVRDLVTTKSIRAVLSDAFPIIENLSVIGYGDFEMKRDQFGGFGLGAGGKVNIYVRTSREPKTTTLVRTVDSSLEVKLETPGVDIPFYRVKSVVKADSPGTSVPYTLTRSLAPVPQNELLNTQAFARFSIYERATLTFTDATLIGKDVFINLTHPEEVDDIQRYVLDDDNRVVSADLLVYGVIPCFVKLKFSFVRDEFGETVDLEEVKNALKSHINTLPPGQPLSISKLIDIVHDFEVIRVKIPTIELTGELEKPNGTVQTLTTDDTLDIPSDFPLQQSQNTAAYFITSEDITISEVSS